MSTNLTQVTEINLQPSQAQDYSTYVPIRLGNLTTAAFIDSGNTFTNVISPQMMTALGITISQLEPVPQLSVGTAAAGKRMKVLGQARRIDLQLGQHPAKFRIRPLVLQGLVHPVNICGPFLARAGIDQIHSKGVLQVCGKDVPMCPPRQPSRPSRLPPPRTFSGGLHLACLRPLFSANNTLPAVRLRKPTWAARLSRSDGRSRAILSLRVRPRLPAGTLVLLQPAVASLLGNNPILQEIQPDGSLSVLADNWETTDLELAPDTLIGSVQEVTTAPSDVDPETSPPPEATTHAEFDALPQSAKIKWLVANFRLDSSPLLQRDSVYERKSSGSFSSLLTSSLSEGMAKRTSFPMPSPSIRGPLRSR